MTNKKKVKVYLCKTDYLNGIVSCTLEFDEVIQEDIFFNKTKEN